MVVRSVAGLRGRLGGDVVEGGASRLWGRLVVLRSVAGLRGRLIGVVVVVGASRLCIDLISRYEARRSHAT